MCIRDSPSAFFSLPAAGLSSCSRLRSTQRARPDPLRKFGPWPGSVAQAIRVQNGKSARGGFRARTAIQAHANPWSVFFKCPTGCACRSEILLTARTDCLPTSRLCSKARSRARVHLVLMLECSCSCSRARDSKPCFIWLNSKPCWNTASSSSTSAATTKSADPQQHHHQQLECVACSSPCSTFPPA